MKTDNVVNIKDYFQKKSFTDPADFLKTVIYENGIALAYISYDYSEKFPLDTHQAAELLRDDYKNLTFLDFFLEFKNQYFDGNILCRLGATPGLKHRGHKEELLEIVENIAKNLPRLNYNIDEKKPIYFIRPHKDFDFLLGAKGYQKLGNRRWKEI
jgi:hypothetical protein